MLPRHGNGFQFATVLSLCILSFAVFAFIQTGRTMKDAEIGLLRFEERQKDLFIDAGLITQASRLVPLSQSAASLRSQTVIVGTTQPHNRVVLGSGVIVGRSRGSILVITARHVVKHVGQHFVIMPEFLHAGVLARRIVMSSKYDLALVYVRDPLNKALPSATLAATELLNRERFTVMGHPGSKSWVASPGVAERHLHYTLLFCPTCDYGDSGAGVFDARLRLHGIVVSKIFMRAPSSQSGKLLGVTAFLMEPVSHVRQLISSGAAQ